MTLQVNANSVVPSVAWQHVYSLLSFLFLHLENTIHLEPIHSVQLIKKPWIPHLRAYGCRTYVHDPDVSRGAKLDPRAKVEQMVGYEGTNLYRIWVPLERRSIVLQGVTFDEDSLTVPAVRNIAKDSASLSLDNFFSTGNDLLGGTARTAAVRLLASPGSLNEEPSAPQGIGLARRSRRRCGRRRW